MITDWENIGKNCVRAALDSLRELKATKTLDDTINPHTDADLASHNAIIAALKESGISCTLTSEEAKGEILINGGGDTKVIIDPIDGTTHFMRGELAFCAVGMIVIEEGRPAYSFVGDVSNGDIYYCDSVNAYKNDIRMVNPDIILGKPVLAGWALAGPRMEKFCQKFLKLRNDYLTCNFGQMLQAAKIIDGRYDACFEIMPAKLQEFAGAVVAWRAGGQLTTLEGNPILWNPQIRQTMLVSRNSKLHQQLLTILNEE